MLHLDFRYIHISLLDVDIIVIQILGMIVHNN